MGGEVPDRSDGAYLFLPNLSPIFRVLFYIIDFHRWDIFFFQAPPPPLRSSPERDVENNLVVDAEKVSGPRISYGIFSYKNEYLRSLGLFRKRSLW